MSKDKPELGDIWQYKNGMKIVIVKETTSIDIFREPKEITSFIVIEDDGEPNIHEEIVFYEGFTYLGKSKAKIEDLFKTKNECCIEDNTPHTESTILFKDLENNNDK